jgi:zinc protease
VLSKDFDLALDFVSELLQRANFPEDRVKMAVARRLDEIKSRLDTPSTLASDTFNELVYAGHPAHRPAIGYEATVSKLTRAQMVAFHRRFFRPENTVVAVVGDFDARTVRERIEKAFADWRADGKFAPPAVPTIVRQTKPLEKTVAVNKEQVNIFMGHLGVARSHPDYYALQVLDTILGNSPGFTSRIPRILRDAEGLAYSAFSDMTGSAGVDPGRFVAYIGCSVENEAKALAGLRREIARIVKDPVSAQELADAQAYLTGSFVLELESNTQIADFLLNAEIYGLGFDYPEKYSQLIRAVTAADIARVARERLSPETMTTVVVGPRKKGETQN